MLHSISGYGQKRPSHLSVFGQLADPYGINGASCAVGRVLHREAQLEINGHISKDPAFHSQEADLVIFLPGHIVGWADVYIIIVEGHIQNRLHSFRLADLLGFQPLPIEHIQEIGIPANV